MRATMEIGDRTRELRDLPAFLFLLRCLAVEDRASVRAQILEALDGPPLADDYILLRSEHGLEAVPQSMETRQQIYQIHQRMADGALVQGLIGVEVPAGTRAVTGNRLAGLQAFGFTVEEIK